MKRYIAMLFTLLLVFSALPAFAAGSIVTTEDTWYVVSHNDDYRVYYYAVVSNLSDKPASINDLLFEVLDRDNMDVDSTSKYKMYPEVLAAGQSGWLVISKDLKDIDNRAYIDHYNLTITSKVNEDKVALPLQASAEYLAKDEDDNENIIRATVTNTGAGNAFDITVAMAIRDPEKKLLYIASDASKDFGLSSGNSFTVRSAIKSDIVDELEDANVEIAIAEAFAYTVEDTDDD